jgi:hypothetical protein
MPRRLLVRFPRLHGLTISGEPRTSVNWNKLSSRPVSRPEPSPGRTDCMLDLDYTYSPFEHRPIHHFPSMLVPKSTYISLERTDFKTLRAISPHPISGGWQIFDLCCRHRYRRAWTTCSKISGWPDSAKRTFTLQFIVQYMQAVPFTTYSPLSGLYIVYLHRIYLTYRLWTVRTAPAALGTLHNRSLTRQGVVFTVTTTT